MVSTAARWICTYSARVNWNCQWWRWESRGPFVLRNQWGSSTRVCLFHYAAPAAGHSGLATGVRRWSSSPRTLEGWSPSWWRPSAVPAGEWSSPGWNGCSDLRSSRTAPGRTGSWSPRVRPWVVPPPPAASSRAIVRTPGPPSPWGCWTESGSCPRTLSASGWTPGGWLCAGTDSCFPPSVRHIQCSTGSVRWCGSLGTRCRSSVGRVQTSGGSEWTRIVVCWGHSKSRWLPFCLLLLWVSKIKEGWV